MSIERTHSGFSGAGSPSELAHCSISGDPGAEIALLLLESAMESRQQSAAQRAQEERHLTQLEANQVEQMMDAADATRAAGWARGLGMMASGTLDVIGSTRGLAAGEAKGQLVAGRYSAAGKIVEGGLDLAAATLDSDAKELDAAAMRSGNQAKQAERRLDDIRQQSGDANDLARTALQAASDWVRSETATEQATIYLRG